MATPATRPAFAGIGERYGPFELTMLPIGAYDARWPDVHLNPEEAVRVHRELRGEALLPIHWATFDLAFHEWSDPVEWLLKAADDGTLALPAPGGRVDPAVALPTNPGGAPPPDRRADPVGGQDLVTIRSLFPV